MTTGFNLPRKYSSAGSLDSLPLRLPAPAALPQDPVAVELALPLLSALPLVVDPLLPLLVDRFVNAEYPSCPVPAAGPFLPSSLFFSSSDSFVFVLTRIPKKLVFGFPGLVRVGERSLALLIGTTRSLLSPLDVMTRCASPA